MMLVHCVGCDFEGYVEYCDHQLCNGCRHDPSAVARAKAGTPTHRDEAEEPLGNHFWAEYIERSRLMD
jgi:hypothetical protein